MWSGIRGWSVLGTIGDIVTGNRPNQDVSNPLKTVTQTASSVPTGSIADATGLAGVAMQYVGHTYRFGGAPGPDGRSPWDCSSFMNYVIGVKARMAIPGYSAGSYSGKVHGPTTGQWVVWTGMSTVKRPDVQPGDIILWAGHMGMAVSNTSVVSALNPRKGTLVTEIDKGVGRGPIVRIGRLR